MSASVALLAIAACSQEDNTQTGADTTNRPIEQDGTGAIDNGTAPAEGMDATPAPDAELAPASPDDQSSAEPVEPESEAGATPAVPEIESGSDLETTTPPAQ